MTPKSDTDTQILPQPGSRLPLTLSAVSGVTFVPVVSNTYRGRLYQAVAVCLCFVRSPLLHKVSWGSNSILAVDSTRPPDK